jgi:hypothetical protein
VKVSSREGSSNFLYMDTTTASVGSSGDLSPGCPAGLSEYVFKVDESVALEGCVFRCINLWLTHANLEKFKIQELRAAIQSVWRDCKRDENCFEKVMGEKSLGSLAEDECCFPQVGYALQTKFGQKVVFKRLKRQEVGTAKFALFQVVMNREEPEGGLHGGWHNLAYVRDDNGLLITGYAGHSSDEFNDQWLHCILVDFEKEQFFCHNLDEWTHIKHLDLNWTKPEGTNSGGYIRKVERMYSLSVQVVKKRPVHCAPFSQQTLGKRPKLLKNEKKLWSYLLEHYDNAAPCSYGGFTSLAICQSKIRNQATKGDIIVGLVGQNLAKKTKTATHRMAYMAIVGNKLSMEEYCNKYANRPDAIYDFSSGTPVQKPNPFHTEKNMKSDLSGPMLFLTKVVYFYNTEVTEKKLEMIGMLKKQRSADEVTRGQSRSSLIDEFYPAALEFKDVIDTGCPFFGSTDKERQEKVRLMMLLFGTALFNNDGHDGPAKLKARSKNALELVQQVNQLKPKWQTYELFKVDDAFRVEINSFRETLNAWLQKGYSNVRFQDIDDAKVSNDADLTYAPTGELLMATIDITKVWPSFNHDVAKLYELAKKLLPKHDRSKNENRKEWMHSFGVKQLGMGENKYPILLKIKNKPGYQKFLKHAAPYFVKQQMLEEMIAPDNSKTRKTMRDEYMTNSCCAIPGLEDFLNALACSITKNYFPDLHEDTPNKGTLECILFSASFDAVFATEYGDTRELVHLNQPKLILLDSKRLKHAARPSKEAAFQ